MKSLVPDFHELTADILSSILLVDCVFPDCDTAFCDSAYKCCVAVFNARLYFGVDAALGKSGKICPDLPHQ